MARYSAAVFMPTPPSPAAILLASCVERVTAFVEK
jgi:hypothetical protein